MQLERNIAVSLPSDIHVENIILNIPWLRAPEHFWNWTHKESTHERVFLLETKTRTHEVSTHHCISSSKTEHIHTKWVPTSVFLFLKLNKYTWSEYPPVYF